MKSILLILTLLASVFFGNVAFALDYGAPFDSRWQITEAYGHNSWQEKGACYATGGEGKNTSYITAESDDCLVFGVPVSNLTQGTDVEFCITIAAADAQAPQRWLFEYYDKTSGWIKGREFTILKNDAPNYSFTSFSDNFTTASAYQNDTLLMRCRALAGGADERGTVFLAPFNWEACRIFIYPADRFPGVIDTKKVMAVGNSFSYCYGAVWMLKEIARSQGHRLDLRLNIKPSQTLCQQLELQLTQAVIEEGEYDFAFLQEQSTRHSDYASDSQSAGAQVTLESTREMVNRIKASSPYCKVFLESTWAFAADNYMGYGSYDRFDESLQRGTALIAAASGASVSPVGKGFAACRAAGIKEEWIDDKHQSECGSYTKACINYLMMYGAPFKDTASDCNLPADTAARIREITQELILHL